MVASEDSVINKTRLQFFGSSKLSKSAQRANLLWSKKNKLRNKTAEIDYDMLHKMQSINTTIQRIWVDSMRKGSQASKITDI